jgi:hypothetical protein
VKDGLGLLDMDFAEPASAAVHQLHNDLRGLIAAAKQRTATTVNAEMTLLYWAMGTRIHEELLKTGRAAYGEQVVHELVPSFGNTLNKDWI